jgi:hypothetical protein
MTKYSGEVNSVPLVIVLARGIYTGFSSGQLSDVLLRDPDRLVKYLGDSDFMPSSTDTFYVRDII